MGTISSKWQSKRVVIPGILTILLASCQTMDIKEEIEEDWYCAAFIPISWSKLDTVTTTQQIIEHNAVWHSVCGKRGLAIKSDVVTRP